MTEATCDDLHRWAHRRRFLRPWAEKLRRLPWVIVPCTASLEDDAHLSPGDRLVALAGWATVSAPRGGELGVVLTDIDGVCGDERSKRIPASMALQAWLDSPRVRGVVLDCTWPERGAEDEGATTLDRQSLALLLGMVRSPDPWSRGRERHLELARCAHRQGAVAEALHHAGHARSEGGSDLEALWLEVDALLALGLHDSARLLLDEASDEGDALPGRIRRARLLTHTGEGRRAEELLRPHLEDPELGGLVRLELARALLARENATDALSQLVVDGDAEPPLEAWLLRGQALRLLHEPSGDVAGLNEALSCLAHVAGQDGNLAEEALSQTTAIYLAVAMWEHAEHAARRSLRERPTTEAYRRLVLALHGQGRVQEARSLYPFLA